MKTPLVSVVCVCYNHGPFVEAAIRSVLNQTYPQVEIIVVDDHSTDHSAEVIRTVVSAYPAIMFLPLTSNQGNCRAFNAGWAKATGDFIIDLSTDDVLEPDRIEKGVARFLSEGTEVGVHFSDARLIDASGTTLGFHSDRFPHAGIVQGDVYREVLSRYFINSPTLMMRKTVLEKLGGYDETLAYEDFDFLVRASRYFKFVYSPEALVRRRIVATSLGARQYKRGSQQLVSTLRVCQKASAMNRTMEERRALRKRVRYEMLQVVRLGEFNLARHYAKLLI